MEPNTKTDARATTLSKLFGLVKSPAAVYLGAAVLSRAGSLFLIPLYTRRLSLEEYGRYALFLTLLTFLSTFLSAGLVAAIPSAYFSQQDRSVGKQRASEVAQWAAVLSLLLAGFSLACIELFAPRASSSLFGHSSLRLATIGGAGMAIGTVPWTLLRSEQRPYPAAAFQLFQFIVMTLAGLVFVLVFDRGYAGAIEAAAGASALTGVVSLAYISLLPTTGLSVARLKTALRFALPFIPHFLAQWILGASDLWIMGEAGFDEQLGSYSLAAQVIVPVTMVMTAWNQHMGPEIGTYFRRGGVREIEARLTRIRLSYLGAALVPSVAMLLGLPLVAWLLGASFAPALVFVPFLLLAILPNVLYFSDFQVLYYAGRTGWIGGATVIAAGASLVFGLILIPMLGAYGAIIARLSGALVRALVVVQTARMVRKTTESPTRTQCGVP